MLLSNEISDFLEEKYDLYNRDSFISSDPISIPHSFSSKEDIEISGFLTATIAWGQRVTIIKNAKKMMALLDEAPFDYVMNFEPQDISSLQKFVHRTFNGLDFTYFLTALQHLYRHFNGLEGMFSQKDKSVFQSLCAFKSAFFQLPHLPRTQKHVSDPGNGSSAKRLNMFLRWMVRKDPRGVDFGLWQDIKASELYIPLDVHSGKVARKLGLLQRQQNDWKAVEELTFHLRELDPDDPVKYDYALFGLGVFEQF